jgi:DNA-binding beta-propeller fold protein YncE
MPVWPYLRYRAIQPETLADFDEDTLLVWVDLVSDGFNGTGRVEFQYVYDDPDSVDPKGEFPCAASIPIPLGTDAHVSLYNLCSLFVYEEPATNWYEARVGVFISPDAGNQGRLFIDNLRLDVVSPYDDYSKFESYDSTESWVLNPGNGMRKVFGQFSDGAGNETGVLFDTIVVDTTLPAAHISSPQSDQVISGTVEIAGWAFDYADPNQHFRQYELLYQPYSSEYWYGIDPDSLSLTPKDSTSPPSELGKWETETVSDGWYYLKLVVCDSASNEQDDTISVCVSNKPKGKGEMSGFSNDVYGLAVRNSIYVGESGTGMIHRYSLNFQPIDTFTIVDSSGIGFPLAMMIDDFGNLWVVNITNHSINQFTTQGNLLWQFAGGFDMPSGVTLDNSGNVWISDRLHHTIKGYSLTGNLLCEFGSHGSEPGEIDRPIGVATHDGKIYIADSKNKRVSVFDTLGSFVDVIGDSSGLLMPFGLAMDSSGCLFVSDFVGNQIIEFGPSGNRLFGIDSSLNSPTGLAFSSDAKTLYVSDTENKRVLAYEVRSEPPLTGGGPQAMGEVDINKLSFDIFPSPFASRLTIRLQGVAGNRLTLKFYDVTGRLVKTFFDNDLVKCNQHIIWDGRDSQCRKCAAGIYFLRFEIGEYRDIEKVVLMR